MPPSQVVSQSALRCDLDPRWTIGFSPPSQIRSLLALLLPAQVFLLAPSLSCHVFSLGSRSLHVRLVSSLFSSASSSTSTRSLSQSLPLVCVACRRSPLFLLDDLTEYTVYRVRIDVEITLIQSRLTSIHDCQGALARKQRRSSFAHVLSLGT